MTDVHKPRVRSYNMSQIKGKDTKPELLVRKFLFSKGFRYRTHDKKLPGKPDIILKKYKIVVFINGCFWHGHRGCKYFIIPQTKTEWWKNKINSTKKKDKVNISKLRKLGWNVITIWECNLNSKKRQKTLEKLIQDIQKSIAIPVIDLFAGPGGLGEGFSTCINNKSPIFKIKLSIESEENAHKTLLLRSFYRQFPTSKVPDEYYELLKGKVTMDELFNQYTKQAECAKKEAWQATLGKEPASNVDKRIKKAIGNEKFWVLIGGPPCQAYSIVGRSRSGGIDPDDERVYLYREYYRILAIHNPPVFIMENVKGLLSAEVEESKIFQQILDDLKNPVAAYRTLKGNKKEHLECPGYKIYSLANYPESFKNDGTPVYKHSGFIIKAEDYGIPQSRHRVILLGIRNDFNNIKPAILSKSNLVTVGNVINKLPKLRGGLSKETDTPENWKKKVSIILKNGMINSLDEKLKKCIKNSVENLKLTTDDRGGEFISVKKIKISYMPEWFIDPKLNGICNHSTRAHISEDLLRYLFVSCFGETSNVSPKLKDFPIALLPKHKNAKKAMHDNKFADRFRVQLVSKPSKTITSHISKDGHYYIHPDPTQCRSLTVREAARIQTFPDNYFFCGPRTSQYIQVGNAVPPYLAKQIGEIVKKIFYENGR